MRNLEVIPATLSFLMRVRGIDQAQLAKRTGMHKSQLSGYLSGSSTPKLPQLHRLMEGLDVTAVQFFMVTDRMQDLSRRLGKRVSDETLRAVDPVFAVVLKAADEARQEAEEAEAAGRPHPREQEAWPRKFLLAQKLAQRSNLLYLEALEDLLDRRTGRGGGGAGEGGTGGDDATGEGGNGPH